jgi:hypothetical protein
MMKHGPVLARTNVQADSHWSTAASHSGAFVGAGGAPWPGLRTTDRIEAEAR